MFLSFFKFTLLSFLLILLVLFGIDCVFATSSYPVDLLVIGELKGKVQWAIPEERSGLPFTNWDTVYYLYFKDPLTSDLVYKMDFLTSTTVGGESLDELIFPITVGNYDVFIKTNQHLSRKLPNILLNGGLNIFNFTTTNSAPGILGSIRLLAGDINGLGTTPDTLGDNTINSIDLSIILNDLDKDDLTKHDFRSNLNQDVVVNSVDLSLLLKNLDLTGE